MHSLRWELSAKDNHLGKLLQTHSRLSQRLDRAKRQASLLKTFETQKSRDRHLEKATL